MKILNPPGPDPELEPDPSALSGSLLRAALAATASDLAGEAAALRPIDPTRIESNAARIAFWLNVYNALLRHVLSERPFKRSVLRHLRAFNRYCYEIGGQAYSLNAIEHGVLRRNCRPPSRLRPPLRAGDPRLAALPACFDPRIHFALNCGARSCPSIRIYSPGDLEAELEAATRTYLEVETDVDGSGAGGESHVTLPGLIKLYSRDFGDREAQLRFAAQRLPALEQQMTEGSLPQVSYARFDWSAVPVQR